MARRRYALERGGPRRLEVRWRWGMRDLRATLAGGPSWALDRDTLRMGATLILPDGASLFLRWEKPRWCGWRRLAPRVLQPSLGEVFE